MQRKLTTEQIGKLKQARNGICSVRSIWEDTDEGRRDWQAVVDLIDAKIHNGTSDGKPYVDPEPPMPEGWRRAEADEWTRTDTQYWDIYRKDWRPRSSQGTAFDPVVMKTRYIVPIDPPLTDQDAKARPLVMVRDAVHNDWVREPKILVSAPPASARYVVVDDVNDKTATSWEHARRATPAEIEAAGLDQSTKVEPCRGHEQQGPQ